MGAMRWTIVRISLAIVVSRLHESQGGSFLVGERIPLNEIG